MKTIRRTVIECVILIVLAMLVGLIANGVNADGIRLSRNYFAKGITATRPASPTTRTASTQPPSSDDPARQANAGKADPGPAAPGNGPPEVTVNEWGIQMIPIDLAVQWHESPLTAAGVYVWVDARKAEAYEDGHIPGARLCNHYKIDQYLPDLLGQLQVAEKIIVYCGGGDCEDSNQLATHLIQEAGLDFDRIYVYEQGWDGWTGRGLPGIKGSQP